LQKLADAAALAAVQDLPTTDTAKTTANTYVTRNGGDGTTVDVSFSTTKTANDTVTVKVTKAIDYTFLRVVGISGNTVSASAKAKGEGQKAITGYSWNTIAPFVILGGSRQREVHSGDGSCPLHTCVGRSYTFMDTNWMSS